jgi:hypothetical protein
MLTSSTQRPTFILQPIDAWLVIIVFGLISLAFVLVGAGKILNFAFPLGAFAVAIFLYWKYPLHYLGFTWWITFLSPFVRRLADYRSGWTDPSPVLLAPVLVSLVAGITLIRYFPKVYNRGGLPFTLCLGSILYSLGVALAYRYSPTGVILSFLSWFTPILLGFHIFIQWEDYPIYRKHFQRVFIWSAIVIGVYGVIQYTNPLEWDKTWLNNVINEKGIVSFGKPAPQEIRVFSTLNSPQTHAAALVPSLLLVFSGSGSTRFVSTGIGFLSFLLSSARAAWVSWFFGVLVYLPTLKSHLQIRLISSIFVAMLIVLPLTTVEPFSTVISSRVGSLTNFQQDSSYQARAEAYGNLFNEALVEFLGKGMSGGERYGGDDNGLLTMVFTLGWLGTASYLVGLALPFHQLLQNTSLRQDPFASAAIAISIASFQQIISNIATTGLIGTTLWAFLGIALAASKYHKYQKRLSAAFLQQQGQLQTTLPNS